jgi:hypothetical protein
MKDHETKIKVLEDILAYLQDAQGSELKSAMEPATEELESEPKGNELGEDKDKDVMAAMGEKAEEPASEKDELAPGEEEMSDDELDELLREHLKG